MTKVEEWSKQMRFHADWLTLFFDREATRSRIRAVFVVKMKDRGMSLKDSAKILGVSNTRASQLYWHGRRYIERARFMERNPDLTYCTKEIVDQALTDPRRA